MVRALVFLLGLLILAGALALPTYLLMPFPGSQTLDALDAAYAADRLSKPLALLGASLAIGAAVLIIRRGERRLRYVGVALGLLVACAATFGSMRMSARSFFRQPEQVVFARGPTEAIPETSLVLGVLQDGQAIAYPVRLLAYHHVLRDDAHGRPLLPTY